MFLIYEYFPYQLNLDEHTNLRMLQLYLEDFTILFLDNILQ